MLTEPKNAVVKQKRFEQALNKVELHITGDALRAVAAIAVKKGTGARGLGAILEKLLLEVKFQVRLLQMMRWGWLSCHALLSSTAAEPRVGAAVRSR